MTGAQSLQTALNLCTGSSLTVDGKVGRGTEAAVRAFQTSKGFKADGVVGPTTGRAIEMCGTSTTSTTTTTPTGTTTTTTTTTGTTTPVSTGTVGNIKNFRELSSFSGETVNEGDTKAVYQVEIEADNGSALAISSLRLAFKNFGPTGSKLFKRYASTVKVMQGSTEVGSASAADFSESSNIYSANVTLNNATVNSGAKQLFTVYVTANSTIDSTDASVDQWAVAATSVRFSDASGAILTQAGTTLTSSTAVSALKSFDFQKLSSSSVLKARMSLATTNPIAKTIKLDQSNQTQNVDLLKFTVKAEGSDLQVNTLPVKITVSGVGATTSNVVSSLTLSDDAGSLDTVSPSGSSATESVVFGGSSNMRYIIAKDATKTFTVSANLKALTGTTFPAGSTVKVEVVGVDGSSTAYAFDDADIRDVMDNTLGTTSTNRIGSALGDSMTLRTQGVSANVVSSSLGSPLRNSTTNVLTAQDVTYRLNVSATGADFYLPRNAEFLAGANTTTVPTVTGAKGVSFVVLNNSAQYSSDFAAASTSTVGGASGSVSLVSGGVVDSNGLIRITDGTSAVVDFTVTLTDATTAANGPVNQYRVGIVSVNAATTSSATPTLTSYVTLPYATFESGTTASFNN